MSDQQTGILDERLPEPKFDQPSSFQLPEGAVGLAEPQAPQTQAAFEMPEGASSLSLPSVRDENTETQLEELRNFIIESDDPMATQAQVATAAYLQQMYGIEPSVTLMNFPEVMEQIFGRKMNPTNGWEALVQAHRNGQANVEMAKLWSKLKNAGGDDEELLAQIKKIQASVVPLSDIPRSWIQKALLWTAESLPLMEQAFITGGATALVSAAIGGPFGLALTAASIGYGFASTIEMMDIMGGLAYGRMRDEGVPHDIAQYLSNIEGILSGAAESLGNVLIGINIPGLTPALQSAASVVSRKLIAGGAVTRVASQIATRIATQVVGGALGEGVENGVQELVSIATDQISRELSQDRRIPTTIPEATLRDIANRVGQAFYTGLSAGLVFGVAGVPGGVTGTVSDMSKVRTAAETTTSREGFIRQHEASPVAGTAANSTEWREYLGKVWDNAHAEEQESQAAEQPVAPTETEAQLSERFAELQAKAQEGTITADELSELVDTGIALDEVQSQAPQTPAIETTEVPRRLIEMTRAEWLAAQQLTTAEGETLAAPSSEAVTQRIREAFPTMSDEEVTGASLILDMRAEVVGLTTEEYVAQTFQPEMFTAVENLPAQDVAQGHPANVKGAVGFAEDGRAIIGLTKASDFSTFVHESGHIFQRQLDTAQAQVAESYYKVENSQWTVEQEEAFATDFENYLQEGKAPTEELRTVFQRFAQWMKRIYQTLRGQVKPEIRQVFDSLLTKQESGIAQAEQTSAQATPQAQRIPGALTSPGELEVRKLVRDMTDQEKVDALLLSDVAGIPNKRAYREDIAKHGGPYPIQVSLDADSLKWINDNLGHEYGNDLLRAIGQAMADVTNADEANPVYGYHLSGDEFAIQGQNIQDVLRAINNLEDQLARSTIEATVGDHTAVFTPSITFGVDENGDFNTADQQLNQAKSKRETEGRRAGRGETPPALVVRESGGRELDGASRDAFFRDRATLDRERRTGPESNYAGIERRRAALRSPVGTQAPDILYQTDAHEAAIEQAVNNGQWVNDRILEEYASREWAKAEIERRTTLRQEATQIANDANPLEDVASTESDWIDQQLAMDSEPGSVAYYKALWQSREIQPTAQEVVQNNVPKPTAEAIAKQWASQITPDILKNYLIEAGFRGQVDTLMSMDRNAGIVAQSGTMSDAQYKKIVDKINYDPLKWYQDLSAMVGDDTTLRAIEQAMRENPEESELQKRKREIQKLREQNKDLEKSISGLDRQVKIYSRVIGEYEGKVAEQKQQITDIKARESQEQKAIRAEGRSKLAELRRMERKAAAERLREYKATVSAAKKAKAYLSKLTKRIMRPPAALMAVEQADQLKAIQDGLDTRSFMNARTKAVREMLQTMQRSNAEVAAAVEQQLGKRSLRDMPIEEVEQIAQDVWKLRQDGKAEREKQLAADRAEIAASKHALLWTLGNGKMPEELTAKGSKETTQATRTSLGKSIQFETLRPPRIAMMLDNGVQGEFYHLLRIQVNQARSAEFRASDERILAGEQEMKRLGVTQKALVRELTEDGFTFTVDDALSIYIGGQNADSEAALLYGNKIEQGTIEKLIGQLSQAEKDWGDWMIESFGPEQATRIDEVLVKDKNIHMERVEKYFPMVRQNAAYDTHDATVLEDAMGRTSARKAYANKGFTKSRTKISPQHQTPIKLGATKIWAEQIVRQEHYIQSGLLIKKLHRILEDPQIQEVMRTRYGETANKWTKKFINDFANPNMYKVYDGTTQTLQILRNHAALSYLAFNVVTMAKQAPSMAYFLSKAGPGDMLSATAQYLKSPIQTDEEINQKDPYMKHRAIDRAFEELKLLDKNAYERLVKRVGQVGMYGIRFIDKQVTNIGWLAVYNRSIRQGMSEQEAVRLASEAVRDTQPAAMAEDLAQIYRTHEALNWFLMFTNQLNQIWNMVSFDLPNAIKQGDVKTALSYAAAVSIGAIAMGFIARGFRFPDREKDKKIAPELARDFATNLVSTIPLVGGTIKSGMEGWFGTGIDPFPVAEAVGRSFRAFTSESTPESKVSAMINLLEQGMVASGLPTVQPKRFYNAITDGEVGELFGIKGE